MNMRKWPRITKALIAIGLVLTISTQVYATSLDDAQQDKKDAEDADGGYSESDQ